MVELHLMSLNRWEERRAFVLPTKEILNPFSGKASLTTAEAETAKLSMFAFQEPLVPSPSPLVAISSKVFTNLVL